MSPPEPKAAMIFAAGLGTRMGALTVAVPKPLIKVAGRSLLDRTLDLTRNAGISSTVVNVHYLGAMIKNHLAGQSVAISDEAEKLLETGGGLKKALPLLKSDPVYTLNSDAVFDGPNPLSFLLDHWNPTEMDALLLLVAPESAAGYRLDGDFALDQTGRLSRAPGFVYSGVQIIKTKLVAGYPGSVFSLNCIWDHMLKNNTAFGAIYPGRWCDVGHPDGIGVAERVLVGEKRV